MHDVSRHRRVRWLQSRRVVPFVPQGVDSLLVVHMTTLSRRTPLSCRSELISLHTSVQSRSAKLPPVFSDSILGTGLRTSTPVPGETADQGIGKNCVTWKQQREGDRPHTGSQANTASQQDTQKYTRDSVGDTNIPFPLRPSFLPV